MTPQRNIPGVQELHFIPVGSKVDWELVDNLLLADPSFSFLLALSDFVDNDFSDLIGFFRPDIGRKKKLYYWSADIRRSKKDGYRYYM